MSCFVSLDNEKVSRDCLSPVVVIFAACVAVVAVTRDDKQLLPPTMIITNTHGTAELPGQPVRVSVCFVFCTKCVLLANLLRL